MSNEISTSSEDISKAPSINEVTKSPRLFKTSNISVTEDAKKMKKEASVHSKQKK